MANSQYWLPYTESGLRMYDHLSAADAAALAWHQPGRSPYDHSTAKAEVRKHMPLLARALDRALPPKETQ